MVDFPRKEIRWEYWLCNTADRTKLGKIKPVKSPHKLNLLQNRPGDYGCGIALDSDLAFEVEKFKTMVRAVRNGRTIWSGMVTTINDDADANTRTIGCHGWLEELYHRIIRVLQDAYLTSLSVDISADDLIYAILDQANKQRTGDPTLTTGDGTNGDPTKPLRPTHITQGTATLTDPVNYPAFPVFSTAYQRGQGIGNSIQGISDVENGVDLDVDPDTLELNLYYPRRGVQRPKARFGYNTFPRNLKNAVRNDDGMQAVQRYGAVGSDGGTGLAEDLALMDELGIMFEEENSLNEVSDLNVLRAYAGVEVAIRGRGLITDTITLFPRSEEGERKQSIPKLFDDYEIGDMIPVSVDKGAFQIDNQYMRVYGANITVDANGNEMIDAVQTSPPSG